MKIELGLRYKTRNGRLAFVCLHDERNAKEFRFCGVLASEDNFEHYNDLSWLESGKCTHHSRQAYYTEEGFSSKVEFLSQFDLLDCVDKQQRDLFEVEKETKREIEKKLYIAVKALKWIEEQADTSTQYDYEAEVILKNIVFDAQQALEEIEG